MDQYAGLDMALKETSISTQGMRRRHSPRRRTRPTPAMPTGWPSRAVGAYTGLVARGYQSGEIDYDGHIEIARRQACPLVAFAAASIPISAQAHPKNTKRLLTQTSRLETQNVSRETFWCD